MSFSIFSYPGSIGNLSFPILSYPGNTGKLNFPIFYYPGNIRQSDSSYLLIVLKNLFHGGPGGRAGGVGGGRGSAVGGRGSRAAEPSGGQGGRAPRRAASGRAGDIPPTALPHPSVGPTAELLDIVPM